MLKKILKPFQINTILAKMNRIIAMVIINFMVEGNTSVITTTGNRSKPSVAWDDRKPPTHSSVRLSSLKVKPINL